MFLPSSFRSFQSALPETVPLCDCRFSAVKPVWFLQDQIIGPVIFLKKSSGINLDALSYYFDGGSRAEVSPLIGAFDSYETNVTLLVRTTDSDGTLFSSTHSDGDLLLLQLRQGTLEAFFDFGTSDSSKSTLVLLL